jgi:hypothetical protein
MWNSFTYRKLQQQHRQQDQRQQFRRSRRDDRPPKPSDRRRAERRTDTQNSNFRAAVAQRWNNAELRPFYGAPGAGEQKRAASSPSGGQFSRETTLRNRAVHEQALCRATMIP